VTRGLQTTFKLLSKTENEAAVQVLLPALDSAQRPIQEAALRAILERRSLVGQHEIVRRMHTLDEGWKAIISEYRGRMSQALRDAVLDSDPQICANGCQAILWFQEYDLIPALVNATEDDANPNSELAANTLLSLAELLYEELASPRNCRLRRDPQLVRKNVTGSLEESVKRFNKHKRTQPIEAFLLLTGRDNSTLMQILLDPHHYSYVPLIQTLTNSPRPGIMRLVLRFLDDPHAPSAMTSVISHRTDRKFVDHLLRKIGHQPSAGAQVNLKHVSSLAWLRGTAPLLDELDDIGQHSAVQLIMATGMKSSQAYEILNRLATSGKAGGRRAAVAALKKFSGTEANALVLRSLKDPDPQVQAAALAQLRQRGIPGALSILLGLVDSPHNIVRQAARESLSEFSFKRFLAAFDMLDDEIRRSTGILVKRIDANTLPMLTVELTHVSGKRRLRGLAIARAIAIVPEVEETIMELLSDTDHLVRVEAAIALADSDSQAVCDALAEAQHDSCVTVQEAAANSLRLILRRGDQQRPASCEQVSDEERILP
jgi:HEAT repeat protein